MRRQTHSKPTGRRLWRTFAALVVVVLIASGEARSQVRQNPVSALGAGSGSATPDRLIESLSRRGDLTLRDATLESALFTISELWGVNIVAGKVEGAVNGVFKDAPLRDILDTILLSNGYAYRPVGGSLIVSRLQDLGQINPFFVSETIPVGMGEVGEVVEAARLMSTPQGQVRALPSAGAILVVDFPDRVTMIRDLVKQLDTATRGMGSPGGAGPGPRQLEVAYFRTHYISALEASTALNVVLSSDGRSAPVEGDDRLLVVDYAENIQMVGSVLQRLDRPRPQVKIKALIYDISLSDMERIGINWNGISNGTIGTDGVATAQNSGLRFLTQTAAPLTPSASGGAFTFYSLEGDINISALVVALQEAEDSRLLADPNVTVMDNESAKIESISEIPFQQLTQTTGGGNIGTTAFKEVGIKLDVMPKIARDATIDMIVTPEFSRLSGYTPGDNQPIVETRRATTRVRVSNGQTLMIAGLRQRTDVGDFTGVPLLKDLRYIGRLFRSHETKIVESELVVFITPEIIGFSDPLGERDQLTVDTINCRLDRIPAAEGCPSCGQTGACQCSPVVTGEACETVIEAGSPLILPVETAAPELSPPNPGAPALAPATEAWPVTPEEVSPDTVEEVLPESSADNSPLKQPSLAQKTFRRLPPVDRPASNQMLAAESGDKSDRNDITPLRVDYDSRFRAPGSVYPERERLAGRPEKAATPTEEPVKTKSVWQFWK